MTIIFDIIVLRFFKYSGSRNGSISVITCKGRKVPTQLSPLEGSKLNSRTGLLQLMTKDQFLKHRGKSNTTDSVQNNSQVYCCNTSSETFGLSFFTLISRCQIRVELQIEDQGYDKMVTELHVL
jgi:hypothetical protein